MIQAERRSSLSVSAQTSWRLSDIIFQAISLEKKEEIK